MEEIIKIFIGILFLILGYPIGNFLAKITSEELKKGKKWFKLIILVSLVGGVIGIFLRNDFLTFSLFFIALVTSRSLK
jgi:NADH:ubiquinone oxidoreductase subunit 4 (subunit M)